MSPEQAAGKNPELDGRSDQYAMGLILQECVTLRTAVEGSTVQELFVKALQGKRDPVVIGTGPGALPREIDAIVRRATRMNPADRYPTVRDLANEVRRYLRGEAVLALPEGPLRRAGRWLGKHRTAMLTLLLALGLVGAGGTIGALLLGQDRIEREHARELRVSQMAAESAIQTQLVDRDLTRYEAALAELVGAAQNRAEQAARERRGALLRRELRREGDRAAGPRPFGALRPRRERARPSHLARRRHLTRAARAAPALAHAARAGLPRAVPRVFGRGVARPVAARAARAHRRRRRPRLPRVDRAARGRHAVVPGHGDPRQAPGRSARVTVLQARGGQGRRRVGRSLQDGGRGGRRRRRVDPPGERGPPRRARRVPRRRPPRGVAEPAPGAADQLGARLRAEPLARRARRQAHGRGQRARRRGAARARGRRRHRRGQEREPRRGGERQALPVRVSPALLAGLVLRLRRRGAAPGDEQAEARDQRSPRGDHGAGSVAEAGGGVRASRLRGLSPEGPSPEPTRRWTRDLLPTRAPHARPARCRGPRIRRGAGRPTSLPTRSTSGRSTRGRRSRERASPLPDPACQEWSAAARARGRRRPRAERRRRGCPRRGPGRRRGAVRPGARADASTRPRSPRRASRWSRA